MVNRVFAGSCLKKNILVIIKSLFLCCCVLYSVSPLSHDYAIRKIVDGIDAMGGRSASSGGLDIFLLEVICTRLEPVKGSGHATEADKVFFRTEKAILPDHEEPKCAQTGILCEQFTTRHNNISSRLAVVSDTAISAPGIDSLHSGPAPPFIFAASSLLFS